MAPNEFPPGHRLGPYAIEAVIGQGASAIVYRANDPRFGGPVAIKVLAQHLTGDVEAVERFSAEARALRAVDNDAVVSVYDIAQTADGVPYMVLGHADRGTLEDRLALERPATATELRTLLAFFERSLGALHERGLVHRDIKPSNVLLATAAAGAKPDQATFGLLRHDDRLLLGDLGLVKDTTVGRTMTRGAGTHSYAAPEQRAVVSHVTERTDLYAASAVVAEAAIGRVRDADESWEDIAAAISDDGRPSFGDALAVSLHEDPEQRPADVAAWASRLRSALASSDPETLGEAPGSRSKIDQAIEGPARGRPRRGRIAAALALCAALIAGSVLLFTSPTEDANTVSTGPGPDTTVEATATAVVPDTSGTPPTDPSPVPTPTPAPANQSAAAPAPTEPTTTATPIATLTAPASEATPTATLGDEVLAEDVLPEDGLLEEVLSETVAAEPTVTPTAADIRSAAPAQTPTSTPTPTAIPTATAEPTATPTATPTPTTVGIRDVDCATVGSTTVAGPVPGLTVIGTTAETATLSWTPRDLPLSIFVGQRYLDNISRNANTYVAEGLEVGQESIISIAGHDTTVAELVAEASIVCAISEADIPGPPAVGPVMVTDLVATSITSTTATLQWTPAAGGGRYTLWTGEIVPGQRFPKLDTPAAGGSPEGSTSYEFTNLEPGSEIVLGLRTIIGPNQSNLAFTVITTPAG